MEVVIRKAIISDLPIIHKFQQELVKIERPFDSGIPQTGKVEYYDFKKLIKFISVNFLIAEVNGKPVACGFAQIKKNVNWAVEKKYGYIGFMYVDAKFRGKGIGSQIMEDFIIWFKKKNIVYITLKAYFKNDAARSAYRKMGFCDFVSEMEINLNEIKK